jgi:putative ABC transport system permease protein
VGASKGDVARVFNAETFIIGLVAGLIGIGITLVLCIPINAIIAALSGVSSIKAVLPLGGAIILVVLSMGLTILAGLFPSLIAAKKDPVVALRSE